MKFRLFMKVHAFCEEKGLMSQLAAFWYHELQNQCWQSEK